MDEHGSKGQSLPRRAVRSVKVKPAPAPPASLAAKGLDGSELSQAFPEVPHPAMDQKENMVDQELTLTVVLPGGTEKIATVQGSKPMMDLLVTLCATYHLNPANHTIELISSNRNHVKFKPNAPIGMLEAEKIVIKPKGVEEKNKKTAGPQIPEATVRLVINYKKTQKTVLRVNPQGPIEEVMPAICEKCEFDQKSTVLFRDVQSHEPLDLTKSLNDYGLRELYAKDTKGGESPDYHLTSPVRQGDKSPPSKEKMEKETKGIFSVFRKSKKKSDQTVTTNTSTSCTVAGQRSGSISLQTSQASVSSSNTVPSEMPKKRRAPLPPTLPSQSLASDISQEQGPAKMEALQDGGQQQVGVSGGSTQSSLKRTKRKAPPPPGTIVQDEAPLDRSIKVECSSQKTAEEVLELEVYTSVLSTSTTSDIQNSDHFPKASTGIPVPLRSSTPLEYSGDGEPALSSDGKQADNTLSHQESTEQTLNIEETVLTEPEAIVSELSPNSGKEQMTLSGESATCLSVEQNGSIGEVAQPTAGPPSTELLPESQNAGVQTSCQMHVDSVESPRVSQSGPLSPPGASADVQAQPVSFTEPQKLAPLPAVSLTEPASPKRDMATSTEELNVGEEEPQPARTVTPPQAQPEPGYKQPPLYIKPFEHKPKPSNEVTRDYTPKVGLTTYTIVPQKSLEKRRVFEVELTLEHPSAVVAQETEVTSFEYPTIASQSREPQVSGGQAALHSLSLVDGHQEDSGSVVRSNTNASSTSSSQSYEIPAQDENFGGPSSPCDGAAQSEGMLLGNKKVPPATKPKPCSLRLPLHKPTPGYYVTSAAGKCRPVSTGYLLNECVDKTANDDDFPPPPPPVDEEEVAGASPQQESRRSQAPKVSRQWSVPAGELSAERLGSLTAPKPYTPVAPSPFAQAVALAARRSHSYKIRPTFASRSSVIEQDPLRQLSKDSTTVESATLWSEAGIAAELQSGELPARGQENGRSQQVLDAADPRDPGDV